MPQWTRVVTGDALPGASLRPRKFCRTWPHELRKLDWGSRVVAKHNGDSLLELFKDDDDEVVGSRVLFVIFDWSWFLYKRGMSLWRRLKLPFGLFVIRR